MISWEIFLIKIIDDFKNEGYNFNHIEEKKIITIATKLGMSYDFYIKNNMHAVEWKLNAMINKNKNLINSFNRNCRHPLNTKFESYRTEWNDYNNRLWNKLFKSKHEPFRTRRRLRNVRPHQVIKTRCGVLVKAAVLDNLVLYIIPRESFQL